MAVGKTAVIKQLLENNCKYSAIFENAVFNNKIFKSICFREEPYLQLSNKMVIENSLLNKICINCFN
jgi:hypothetical protein